MNLPDHIYDLTYYAYGNVHEHLPAYAHEPLGNNCITLSHYVDANLMNIHAVRDERSEIGIQHLFTKCHIGVSKSRL